MREATTNANYGHTINVTATGSIDLASATPWGDKNLTVQRPASGSLIINGQDTYRIFLNL